VGSEKLFNADDKLLTATAISLRKRQDSRTNQELTRIFSAHSA
jgi:hypothetical protein